MDKQDSLHVDEKAARVQTSLLVPAMLPAYEVLRNGAPDSGGEKKENKLKERIIL